MPNLREAARPRDRQGERGAEGPRGAAAGLEPDRRAACLCGRRHLPVAPALGGRRLPRLPRSALPDERPGAPVLGPVSSAPAASGIPRLVLQRPGAVFLAQGYPAFLLPTQKLERCDWACVEEYRSQIRSGKSIGGLAFWAEGFLSALLDGHHRATAALLERAPLTCLTVMSQGAVEIRDGNKALLVWNERIPFANLPREAVRLLETPPRRSTTAEATPVGSGAEDVDEPWRADPHWQELFHVGARFPEALAVAALEIVGDTSDERIQRLFDGHEHGAPEVWLVLQALIASKDPRAVGLALRVGRAHWPDLWEDAFRFLATTRTQEVEDFFIDFLVRDEGQHPWLEKIANEYFSEITDKHPDRDEPNTIGR